MYDKVWGSRLRVAGKQSPGGERGCF